MFCILGVLQCVAVCCIVLQCVASYVLQCVASATHCNTLHTGSCSVLRVMTRNTLQHKFHADGVCLCLSVCLSMCVPVCI